MLHTSRVLVALALTLVLGACGDSQAGDSGRYTIAVVPKGTSHEFWKSVHAGAERAGAELDVEIVWQGPLRENNTAGQIQVVKDMITLGVDAVCLAPNHSESLVDVVNEAGENEIPVVIFDSGLGAGAEIVSYVATDNFRGGELAADRLVEAMGGAGDVVLLRYRSGSQSTEQREEGFLARLAQAHPDVNVLSSDQHGEESASSAKEKASQLLIQYGDELEGFFAVCEPNANGTLEALLDRGYAGQIQFMAFDPSERLISGMQEGSVAGIVLQDPVSMGYEAVVAAVRQLDGEAVEARIPTGEYVATPDNMGEARMHELLNPVMHGE